MLNLAVPTPDRWLKQIRGSLEDLLIDHANCEKKAASVALNLLFTYPEQTELSRPLADIVQEEMAHFTLVLDVIQRRGYRFRRLPAGRYGQRLHAFVSKTEPVRAVDRLLVAALIEARSCERFGLLRDHLDDEELAGFFGGLFESEARHHSTYVRLAKTFATADVVQERLRLLAEEEGKIILEGDELPRMHS